MGQENRSVKLMPVNGQKICEYAKVPFGWFSIGYNGCVLLAIYNALLLSGYQEDVMTVRRHIHRFWRPRIFGVRVTEIPRCLKKLKIPFRSASSPEEFVAAMKPGSAAILMRWNDTVPYCHFTMGEEPLSVTRFPNLFGGAHGVAVTCEENGVWKVYNRYSNRSTVYHYSDFQEFCPYHTLFMKAFILEPVARGES